MLALFSALAEHNRERKKKHKIPPKSALVASSAKPVTAKKLAGAAAALKRIFLCCFTRGKYMGAKKKSPVAYML